MRVGIDVDGVLRQTIEFGLECFYGKDPKKYLLSEENRNKWEISEWFEITSFNSEIELTETNCLALASIPKVL